MNAARVAQLGGSIAALAVDLESAKREADQHEAMYRAASATLASIQRQLDEAREQLAAEIAPEAPYPIVITVTRSEAEDFGRAFEAMAEPLTRNPHVDGRAPLTDEQRKWKNARARKARTAKK